METKDKYNIGKYVGKCPECELVLANCDKSCPRCSTKVNEKNLTDKPEVKDEQAPNLEVGTDTETA